MTITLANDLIQTVVRNSFNIENQNYINGLSLSTGQKFDIEPVDSFLGSSLCDTSVITSARIKSISYGINLLNVANSHLETISSLLQKSLNILQAVQMASNEQKVILQSSIDFNKQRIEHIIASASFDCKNLLQGDITKINISSTSDSDFTSSQKLSIKNISEGRLFRTSFIEPLVVPQVN